MQMDTALVNSQLKSIWLPATQQNRCLGLSSRPHHPSAKVAGLPQQAVALVQRTQAATAAEAGNTLAGRWHAKTTDV